MSPQLAQLLSLLAAAVIGIFVVPLFDWFKQKVIPFVDGLPAPIQQSIVLAVVYGLNWLATLVGVTPVTQIGGVDSTYVQTLLSAVVAFLLKNAQHVAAVKAAVLPPSKSSPH
jgi:hypothetical protein